MAIFLPHKCGRYASFNDVYDFVHCYKGQIYSISATQNEYFTHLTAVDDSLPSIVFSARSLGGDNNLIYRNSRIFLCDSKIRIEGLAI